MTDGHKRCFTIISHNINRSLNIVSLISHRNNVTFWHNLNTDKYGLVLYSTNNTCII